MSGIAGIIRFDGAPVETEHIRKMTAAMAYRGPDGINHWAQGPVVLGHCMLRTTPESLEETQPLSNEDKSLALVMDGRVDNWEDLRRELLARGAVLRNRSDAELVLKSYEIWGRDCLSKIDGDFSFVIWNARTRQALCARDRMGNKPFHYYWDGNTFVFSSDLHPILALSWVPQIPNEGVVAEFLSGDWLSRDETLWSGVLRLVAAHRMTVGASGRQCERYWEPDVVRRISYSSEEEYFEHYRQLFADSVRRLSRSHRPVSYEVSGGLDSSAVFCMAQHLKRSGQLPAPFINGYTLAFEEQGAANELSYARAVGAHWGVPIKEVPPSRLPLSWFHQRGRLCHDFPGFPNAAMFLGMRKSVVSDGGRVVLTGEGGDDYLQGSRVYYAEALGQRQWSELFSYFKYDVSIFGLRWPLRWLARYGIFELLPVSVQDASRKLMEASRTRRERYCYWLSPKMREVIKKRRVRFARDHNPGANLQGQRVLLEALNDAFTAQIVENLERLGSQSGVEIRSPMRTYRFFEFGLATPERMRLRGNVSKYVHIRALEGFLPQAVLNRRDKAEFSIVMREHLNTMKHSLTVSIPLRRGDWVAIEGVARLFDFYKRNPKSGFALWPLWSLYACDSVVPDCMGKRLIND